MLLGLVRVFLMIVLIIPFLLGAAALITGGLGVAAGIDGVSKIEEAKRLGSNAQERYKEKQESIEQALQVTQNLAEQYGQLQIQVKLETIERFIAFIERIGQQANQSEQKFLEGLEGISPQQIEEYKAATLEAKSITSGGFKAVGVAYAASSSTIALVGLFGTASTGAAIGGLSGAAAWNATLAWLGGGSLVAGGGGMALGSLVLGGIAVGPALMIGGFVLGGEGEKALTEAREYEAKANIEMAKLDTFEAFLDQVQRRITELKELVEKLNVKAIKGLVELESRPFVIAQDAHKFQQVGLLVKALVEIMKTPVLDTKGNLNSATVGLKERYSII